MSGAREGAAAPPPVAWVLGGRGMLGQAVVAALTSAGVQSVVSGQEVDVADGAALARFAANANPTHVINCAAMTAVDACESEQARAFRVNADGPAALAALARQRHLAALHVSTDYVFAGQGAQPYAEDAPQGPQTVYGASKQAGERAFWRHLDGAHRPAFVVRTAWLFGHGGQHFVGTMQRLMAERPAVQVVADQVGSPTYCTDVAAAICGLLGLGQPASVPAPSGTYHVVNEGAASWHALAEAVYQHGPPPGGRPFACGVVEKVTSAAFVRPAPRPAYSVLATDKLARTLKAPMRPWQAALSAYMAAEQTAAARRRQACDGS